MRDATSSSLQRPNCGLDAYVWSVAMVGAVTVVTSLYGLFTSPPPNEWMLFAVLGLVAGAYAVKIPGVDALISASDTFFIASAMLFGPATAMLSLAADGAVLAWRRRYSAKRLLFNVTAPSLSLWGATHVFALLTNGQSLFSPGLRVTSIILPLAAMTAVYFGLNSGLTATAIALQSHQPLRLVWKRMAPLAVNYIAAASAAFCLVIVMRAAGILAASAVVPLVLVFHMNLRSILGRLSDAERHVEQVDRLYLSTVEALATAIEAKDGVTHDHIRRVQRFAVGLAHALGIHDDETVKAIKAAALLHDTGKLAVPERILNKPGKLTASEFEEMKLHVDVGADILSSIDFPYPVVPIVRAHHENWDGSGYPRGLAGDAIPIGARILSVVDCYDALTSDRPYRAALSHVEAMEIVLARRGVMYDPRVVDTFAAVHHELSAAAAAPSPHQDSLVRVGLAIAPSRPAVENTAPEGPASDSPVPPPASASMTRLLEGRATLEDLLRLALLDLSARLSDATCALYCLDGTSGQLVARHAAGPAAEAVRGTSIAMGERLSGWVAASRVAVENSDATLDLFDRKVLLRDAVSLPLIEQDSLIGVLSVYNAGNPGFTDEQRRLARALAPHLARVLNAAVRSEPECRPPSVTPPENRGQEEFVRS